MKYFVLALSLCMSIQSFSQNTDHEYFLKDKNSIGISFRGSFGTQGSNAIGSISSRYGRFVADKFQLGVDLGYTKIDFYGNAVEFGPYARYYFSNKTFSPLAEINYAYGKVTNTQQGLSSNWNKVGADFGFAWTGDNGFGAELLAEYYNIYYQGARLQDVTFIGRILYFF